MLKYFAVFFLAVCSVNGGAVRFTECTGVETTGKLWNLIVPSCAATPCIFEKGGTYSIEFDFDNNRNTTSLTNEVYGIIAGVPLPWLGVDLNACNYMVIGGCPLLADDYVTFKMELKIDPVYPSVNAQLRWMIKGDDLKPIFCVEIPVQLK